MTHQTFVEFRFEFDGTEYSCKLINPEHIPPAHSYTTTVTMTACPDGEETEETASWTVGSLKSDVFGDSLDAGISWALRTIQHTKAKVPYTITHFPELGATGAIEETGEARVNSFTYGAFARTGTWKHSIDVALLTTSGPTRPAAPLKAGSRKAAV